MMLYGIYSMDGTENEKFLLCKVKNETAARNPLELRIWAARQPQSLIFPMNSSWSW